MNITQKTAEYLANVKDIEAARAHIAYLLDGCSVVVTRAGSPLYGRVLPIEAHTIFATEWDTRHYVTVASRNVAGVPELLEIGKTCELLDELDQPTQPMEMTYG